MRLKYLFLWMFFPPGILWMLPFCTNSFFMRVSSQLLGTTEKSLLKFAGMPSPIASIYYSKIYWEVPQHLHDLANLEKLSKSKYSPTSPNVTFFNNGISNIPIMPIMPYSCSQTIFKRQQLLEADWVIERIGDHWEFYVSKELHDGRTI